MLPVPYHNSWSLYVVDVDEKTLLVKDPCETSNGEDAMKLKHEDNANHIIEGLRRCIHENIAGWYVPAQGWRVNYNVGMHPNSEIHDSHLHVVNYIREFTGLYIYNPLTPNRLHYFRQMIAYEVISMRGNKAELPDFMLEVVPF
uniref:Ubiquitin-like protease family profile domain-containing protein n=1 Tax=Triticum aestivum TaxID=4565 RepID=A0A3B6RQ32_WHEAT